MNNIFIVITTINHPSKAIKDFAELGDYRVIVVGDNKTPPRLAYCKRKRNLCLGVFSAAIKF